MLLREAFASDLPESIVQRPKQKFSAGAGSMHELATVAEERFDDQMFARERPAPDAALELSPSK